MCLNDCQYMWHNCLQARHSVIYSIRCDIWIRLMPWYLYACNGACFYSIEVVAFEWITKKWLLANDIPASCFFIIFQYLKALSTSTASQSGPSMLMEVTTFEARISEERLLVDLFWKNNTSQYFAMLQLMSSKTWSFLGLHRCSAPFKNFTFTIIGAYRARSRL